ncbi:hypothetical protein FE257_012324 [Aspergillus nanangensis]|uniref:Uncharacterized protein n=1 Tax=Aspergillus nanangensis TaxID=2582783 RepID=A0AAD4GQU4_ASPNN|nr:hypothetical protein FE257_012324 [Aspergillus nanangensis]
MSLEIHASLRPTAYHRFVRSLIGCSLMFVHAPARWVRNPMSWVASSSTTPVTTPLASLFRGHCIIKATAR